MSHHKFVKRAAGLILDCDVWKSKLGGKCFVNIMEWIPTDIFMLKQ